MASKELLAIPKAIVGPLVRGFPEHLFSTSASFGDALFLLRCPASLRHDPNPSRLRPLALLLRTIIAVFKLVGPLMQLVTHILQHLGNPPVAGVCGQPKAFLGLGAKLVGKVSHCPLTRPRVPRSTAKGRAPDISKKPCKLTHYPACIEQMENSRYGRTSKSAGGVDGRGAPCLRHWVCAASGTDPGFEASPGRGRIIAKAIVEHLRRCRWQFSLPQPSVGHGTGKGGPPA